MQFESIIWKRLDETRPVANDRKPRSTSLIENHFYLFGFYSSKISTLSRYKSLKSTLNRRLMFWISKKKKKFFCRSYSPEVQGLEHLLFEETKNGKFKFALGFKILKQTQVEYLSLGGVGIRTFLVELF